MTVESELARLEKLSDLQLLDVLDLLEDDPAPEHVKKMIVAKINDIMNERLKRDL